MSKTKNSNELELYMRFSKGAKKILLKLLNNTLRAVEGGVICNSAGLGIVARHLESFSHFIDGDFCEFNTHYDGTTEWNELERLLQNVPVDWQSPWDEIMRKPLHYSVDNSTSTSEDKVELNGDHKTPSLNEPKTPEQLGAMAGASTVKASTVKELDSDPLPSPTGRCYSDNNKATLVGILEAGIEAIQKGYIGDASDFGLLALRLASACEQFDSLPDAGDGKSKLIDGMINEWANDPLDAFLDHQLAVAELPQ
ncbi:MAG TPA: hypothetical protein VM260_26595 [Pirellula sp.]|nr:hypothetical protein [Pirellula sp.]